MSPKSLLRHKLSVSSLEDLANGQFQLVIADESQPKNVDRVVLCSGKLYYELVEARQKQELPNVAIVRVEQLYPFPVGQLREELAKYPHACVVWAQEEPHNQGAWLLIQDDLRACLGEGQTLTHSTRPRSAAPATGYHAKHVEQQTALINKALGIRPSLEERALTSDQITS
jgi:2-oxoglutarate dehydrogenase E1 component